MSADGKGGAGRWPSDGDGRLGMAQQPMPLARLARFREATYRLFSQSFLYPDLDRLNRAATAARELLAKAGALRRFAFFARWRSVVGLLAQLECRDVERIQGQHLNLFAANPKGVPCPPYESAYRDTVGGSTGWLLAQVEREYASAGLALSRDSGELPDLVAIEMEFVAVLCGREAQAWEEGDWARAVVALRQQKRFLDSHLARWLPDFGERVRAADRDGMYAALCEGAQAFIGYDVDLLGVLLETFGEPTELDSERGRQRARGDAR